MIARVLAALMFAVSFAACGASPLQEPLCGTGWHAAGQECVADVVCGAGTTILGHTCVPTTTSGRSDAGSITCGRGTTLAGGACVPLPVDAGTTIICGPGTALAGGACVPLPVDAGTTIICGPGTALAGGACVPLPVDAGTTIICGPGTALAGDQCLPVGDAGLPPFIVRASATTVGADGYSAIPVIVIATDGPVGAPGPSVVLGTSRAGAGTISPSAVTVGPAGATVNFISCSSAASMACAGTVRVTLALASAPTEILAESQEINLVAPGVVGSDTPCLSGGNVIFYNGDANDYIFSGIETITQGKWTATVTSTEVHINVWPTDPNQGEWWDLYFDSSRLPGALATQVYENAQRWPFQAAGHPGLDVSGDGRGCNMVSGRFQIEDIQSNNGTLTSFTATFEHHCEGGPTALHGCVHFGM